MVEKDSKNKALGESSVDGVKTISDQRINIAKEEISKDQDVLFQNAIIKTREEAEKIAKETIKEEIESVKKDMLVTFGIFASFIAFIVGEISILKTIDSIYDKIGFSFFFIALITGFLFTIMFLVDRELNIVKYRAMGIVFSLFFLIDICFIVIPNLKLF